MPLPDAVIGAVAGYLSLWLVYWGFKLLTGKEGMGYGDFKMNAAVGAFLGWKMLPLVILLSSVVGLAFGALQMFAARGRWDARLPLPFRPLPRDRRHRRACSGASRSCAGTCSCHLMFVVGLTGGIGSGKSAAADEFARLGADGGRHRRHRARADRRRAAPRVPAIEEGLRQGLHRRDGAMDRKRMREHVFADPAAKRALEALLHPMIREESRAAHRRRARALRGARGAAAVESPDYRSRVDRVLVVDAPEETQVARVRARSGLSEDEVRASCARRCRAPSASPRPTT